MKTRLFLLLCLMASSSIALAEGGCPPGQYPPNPSNTGVCYPFPESQGTAPVQQPAPRGHWETRWGAIVIDRVKGKLGGAANYKSEQAAKKAALDDCYSQGGGKDCKLSISYYNQCAANAWGDNSYTSVGGDTLQEANADAIQTCSKSTPNCKVVYNACSYAQWISY